MVTKGENYLTTHSEIGAVVGNLPCGREVNQCQVRVLLLNDKEHLESIIFYVHKGWKIKFQIGPSLFGKPINLFTNHPLSVSSEYNSKNYQQLHWKRHFNDNSTLHAYLHLIRAGPFHYYFTDCLSNEKLGSGYFIVEPVLTFSKGDVLSLDSVKCQTVLAKCLGCFENWEKCLRVSKESNYNMIHFTPIQELGGSNSSYSLKDQLKLNPIFDSDNCTPTFQDVLQLTNKMRQEWRVLSLGDVVLNHTANETPWLQTHPECTYNMITASHLIPAAILDGNLHVLTKEISEGKHVNIGIPQEVFTEEHIQNVKNYLEYELVPRLRLHEFYTADVEKLCYKFMQMAKDRPARDYQDKKWKDLVFLKGPITGRHEARIDFELALSIFNITRNDVTIDEGTRLEDCLKKFRIRLDELNNEMKSEIDRHLSAAINNCIANMRYHRLEEDGPKIKTVSVECPLVPRYFTGRFEDSDSVEEEVFKNGQFIMAHNGWVMNSNPLENFAHPDVNVYLRRELIAWGDCVKLRYGESHADCPFLWEHMRKYVEMTAEIFDGIRLDNCHSTPLHVAEYLLDCARKIKPDLYVVAELFTNSALTDNIFVNKLGITVLIRETLNAFNSQELGRLIHRYGGEPVGSFFKSPCSPLQPSVARAMLFDITHDNPSLIERRNVFDAIPASALVSMAGCAIGSTRGFDELVPHHINVVTEKRIYPSWTNYDKNDNSVTNNATGIISVKKILNRLHEFVCEEGFNEVYVDQMNENILAVTRHNPTTHEKIILVSYTAFSQPDCNFQPKSDVKNLVVDGETCQIILEAKLLSKDKRNAFGSPKDFKPDKNYINGLTEYDVIMKENIQLSESDMVREVAVGENVSEFEFKNFPPGSILILRVRPHHSIRTQLQFLQSMKMKFINGRETLDLLQGMPFELHDLNQALYRCSDEAAEDGTGTFNVPGYGALVYCGLQGFESVLQDIRMANDLGHPLCQNLREGTWMLDYIVGQLKSGKGTKELGVFLEELFNPLRLVPKYLVPCYFELFTSTICALLKSSALDKMGQFVRNGSALVRDIALGSVQCVGLSETAPLPPFSPEMVASDDGYRKITMSAGLPHFATGYMRSWGRDTFISLRGLFLLTERFKEARYHILGYAACLRHGLIPNLLDRGVNARYNSRDAVWWWLYAIVCFIETVPEGHTILKEVVSRLFPTDDSPPLGPGLVNQPLHSIMQEALSVHFAGKTFRERNAGPGIDAHMTSDGFNITIGIDPETGFVFGGNEFNCGTWMDKMGSDMQTGNIGQPATPRDGSAVELVALCSVVVGKLKILHKNGFYPYEGVTKIDAEGKTVSWSFQEWENRIRDNFEKLFWIPAESSPSESNLIHRRLIYKDSLGATQPWADYQLRPNFLIALALAPDLVDPEKAWKAINVAETVLLGPLGMKTLDPQDWNYNGNYHNDDESGNPKTARGFNYHQGPEWLWPVGFFLRAKLHFARVRGIDELKRAVLKTWAHLGNFYGLIQNSAWRGLPELTNQNGDFCKDGCRVQAWSVACILEVLHDLIDAYK